MREIYLVICLTLCFLHRIDGQNTKNGKPRRRFEIPSFMELFSHKVVRSPVIDESPSPDGIEKPTSIAVSDMGQPELLSAIELNHAANIVHDEISQHPNNIPNISQGPVAPIVSSGGIGPGSKRSRRRKGRRPRRPRGKRPHQQKLPPEIKPLVALLPGEPSNIKADNLKNLTDIDPIWQDGIADASRESLLHSGQVDTANVVPATVNPISLGSADMGTGLHDAHSVGIPANVHVDVPISGDHFPSVHDTSHLVNSHGGLGTHLTSVDLNLPNMHIDQTNGTPVDTANIAPEVMETSKGNIFQRTSSSRIGSLGPGSRRARRPGGRRPKGTKNKRQNRPRNKPQKRPKEGHSEPAPLPGSIHETDVPFDSLLPTGKDNTASGPPSDVHVDIPFSNGDNIGSFQDITLSEINHREFGTPLISFDSNKNGKHNDPVVGAPKTNTGKKPHVQSNPTTNGANPISLSSADIVLGTGLHDAHSVGIPANVHVDVPISGDHFPSVHDTSHLVNSHGGLGTHLTSVDLNLPNMHIDQTNGTPVDTANIAPEVMETSKGNIFQRTSSSRIGSLGPGSRRARRPGGRRPKGTKNKRQNRPRNKPQKRPKEGHSEPAPLPGSIHETDVPFDSLLPTGTDNTASGTTSDVHVDIPFSNGDNIGSFQDLTLSKINHGDLGTHLTSVDLNQPGRQNDLIIGAPKTIRGEKTHVHSNPTTNGASPISLGSGDIVLDTGLIDAQSLGLQANVHVDVPISGDHFPSVHDTLQLDNSHGGLETHLTSVDLNQPGRHSDPIIGVPKTDRGVKRHVHSNPSSNVANALPLGSNGIMLGTGLINGQQAGTPSNVDVPVSSGEHFSFVHDISLQNNNQGGWGIHLTNIDVNLPVIQNRPINETPMTNSHNTNAIALGSDDIILGTGLINGPRVGTPSNVHVDVPGPSGDRFNSVHDISQQGFNHGGLGTHLTSVDLNLSGMHNDQINGAPSDTSKENLLQKHSSSKTGSLSLGSQRARRPRGRHAKGTKNKRQHSPKNKPQKRPKEGQLEPAPLPGLILRTDAPFGNLDTIGTDNTAIGPSPDDHVRAPVSSGNQFGPVHGKPLQDMNHGDSGTHLTSVDFNLSGMHNYPINGISRINRGEKPNVHSNPSTNGANSIFLGNDGIVSGAGLINKRPVGTPSNVHVDVPVSSGDNVGSFHDIPLLDNNPGETESHVESVALNQPGIRKTRINGSSRMNRGKKSHIHQITHGGDGSLLDPSLTSKYSSERSRQPNSPHQTEHNVRSAVNLINNMLTPGEQVSTFASGGANPKTPLRALSGVHGGNVDVGLDGSLHVQNRNRNIGIGQSKERASVNVNTHGHHSAGGIHFGAPGNRMFNPVVPDEHQNRNIFARPGRIRHSPPILDAKQLISNMLGKPTSASHPNGRGHGNEDNVREMHRTDGQHWEDQRRGGWHRGGRRRGSRRRGGRRRNNRRWGRERNRRRRWRNNFQNYQLQTETTTPIMTRSTTTKIPVPRHQRNGIHRIRTQNQHLINHAGQLINSALTGRGSPGGSLLNSLTATAARVISGRPGGIWGHRQAPYPRGAVRRRPTLFGGAFLG